jgi:hypothetical protein
LKPVVYNSLKISRATTIDDIYPFLSMFPSDSLMRINYYNEKYDDVDLYSENAMEVLELAKYLFSDDKLIEISTTCNSYKN